MAQDAEQATAVLASACNPDSVIPPNSGLAGSDELITTGIETSFVELGADHDREPRTRSTTRRKSNSSPPDQPDRRHRIVPRGYPYYVAAYFHPLFADRSTALQRQRDAPDRRLEMVAVGLSRATPDGRTTTFVPAPEFAHMEYYFRHGRNFVRCKRTDLEPDLNHNREYLDSYLRTE